MLNDHDTLIIHDPTPLAATALEARLARLEARAVTTLSDLGELGHDIVRHEDTLARLDAELRNGRQPASPAAIVAPCPETISHAISMACYGILRLHFSPPDAAGAARLFRQAVESLEGRPS